MMTRPYPFKNLNQEAAIQKQATKHDFNLSLPSDKKMFDAEMQQKEIEFQKKTEELRVNFANSMNAFVGDIKTLEKQLNSEISHNFLRLINNLIPKIITVHLGKELLLTLEDILSNYPSSVQIHLPNWLYELIRDDALVLNMQQSVNGGVEFIINNNNEHRLDIVWDEGKMEKYFAPIYELLQLTQK